MIGALVHDDDHSTMSALFTIMAIYGIGFGLFSLPTAMFVGPHLLVASLGHIGVGVLSAIIARGFAHGNDWARWGGLVMSIAIAALSLLAFFQAIRADAVGVAVFFAAATCFVTVLAAAMVFRPGTSEE